jgi:hypothetical protein
MRNAAKARKKQPPPPRAPRDPSRKQRLKKARPSRRSNIDIQGLSLSDVEEDRSDDDEVFDDAAPLTQRGMIKLMSETMAMAMEKADKRNRRSIPVNAAGPYNMNGVPDAPNTGRLALRAVSNPEMADRLGVAPAPNLVIEGDPTSLDVQKIQKHMKSGSFRVAGEFVQRQTTWPEKLLSSTAPGFKTATHATMSFPELIDGLIAKVLVEAKPDVLDRVVANKLSYIRELTTMHYSLDLKNILAINFRFITAWENRSFEWNDWARIEAFCREAKFQELVSAMSSARRAPRPSAPGALGGADNSKKKGDAFVSGVSAVFLKENNLCINFNKGKCQEANTHKHPFLTDKTLYHQCGACKKAGKTDTSHGAHELDKCSNKQPFRR